MIDRIGPSRIPAPTATEARAARVGAPLAAHGAPAPVVPDSASLTNEPRRMAAEGAPIDSARVERLRAVLADGSFGIDPDRIAAAMIAAERIA